MTTAQPSLDIETDTRQIYRVLEVKLQPTQLAQIKQEANETLQEMRRIEGEFEVKKKEFNAEYKRYETQLFALIEKETESQETECTQKTIFNENRVEVWNGDQLIEERALTSEERQLAFGEVQHGVVLPKDDSAEQFEHQDDFPDEATPEQARQDLQDVIRQEQGAVKVGSLIELR